MSKAKFQHFSLPVQWYKCFCSTTKFGDNWRRATIPMSSLPQGWGATDSEPSLGIRFPSSAYFIFVNLEEIIFLQESALQAASPAAQDHVRHLIWNIAVKWMISHVSNAQIQKYIYTNTQIQHMAKCQKDPTCGIFLKRGLFKGIKNDTPMCQMRKYINTNTQIHKYSIW